jgi:hypothetical protein
LGRSDAFTAPFSLALGEARTGVALELLLADWGVDGAFDSTIGVIVVEMLLASFEGVPIRSRATGAVCDELIGWLPELLRRLG